MSAHRYWRLNVTNNAQDTGGVNINNLEMRAVAGGANLSLIGNGTASAKSAYNPASNAFDASDATRWLAIDSIPQWIQWDFGAPQEITEIKIIHGSGGNSNAGMNPKTGTVSVSDDGVAFAEWGEFNNITTAPLSSHTIYATVVEVATVDLSLPMAALNAGGGAAVDVVIPGVLMDAGFGVAAQLSLPALGVAASTGGVSDLSLPMLGLAASAHDSTGENALDITLPMVSLDSNSGAFVSAAFPAMALDAAMTGAALLTADIALPMVLLDAGGFGSPYVVSLDVAIPMAILEAHFGAEAAMSLPMIALEATVTAGGLLTVGLSIPMVSLDCSGTQQNHGRVDITLPMLAPTASITADLGLPMLALDAYITADIAVTYEAYSINLSHRDPETSDEVTRYTHFPFDRIVRYQGSYFGVAADGLYLLEGTTDDGAAIPYAVKTCIDDFKAPELKTVASAYFGGRLGPDATVTLHAGEQGQESYAYTTPRGQGAQNHREKFGRGVKNRYFALGVAGEGAFELDMLELEVHKMSRRI